MEDLYEIREWDPGFRERFTAQYGTNEFGLRDP
jgi:hypothetical protein